MRYFTFLVVSCLLLGVTPWAQAQQSRKTRAVQLKWQGHQEVLGPDRKLHRLPSFATAQYLNLSLLGHHVLSVPGVVSEGELHNATYEPFSASDASLLKDVEPAAGPLEVRTGLERGQPFSLVQVPAIRRNPQSGQLEKLVSFEYRYTLAPPAAARTLQRQYAANSVLRAGQWGKVGVDRSGIFKLDKATLTALGFNVQNLDPSRIQVFGNATGLLPQANAAPRPDDLVENAVYFSGNNNSTFDDNEYLLFYARGPHVWQRDTAPNARRFRHIQHLYSDTAYYFVTVSASRPGRRVQPAPTPGAPNAPAISTFTERWFYERDLRNLAKSGRQWLGEAFGARNAAQRTFTADPMTDLVAGAPVQLTSSVAGYSLGGSSFRITLNGAALPSGQILPPIPRSDYPEYAGTSLETFSAVPAASSSALQIGLTYTGSNPAEDVGYLDYLEVNALKTLRFAGSAVEFRSFDNIRPGSVSQFNLSGGAGTLVWDVTNPRRAVSYSVTASGSFVAPTDSLREFVAFNPAGNFDAPRVFGGVANQDLHGRLSPNGNLDLVIVTYPAFKAEAERLANHRRTHDGLRVEVVTTIEVYNEFGGGGQDITAIRDMMKMVYDRRRDPNQQQFLLLFGDASYDYKSKPSNLTRTAQLPDWWKDRLPANADRIAQNYVPTYESYESFSPIVGRTNGQGPQTFCSDDYYALLDDNEGEWLENGGRLEAMDVGVGRLPIRTPSGDANSTTQARATVDKLIGYDGRAAQGNWRNRLTFVADDGDDPGEGNLFIQGYAERSTERVAVTHPVYNIRKVYLDMYPQVSGSSGQRSPESERALDESFEKGSLIINYNGHGGPTGLTQEQIFNNAAVERLQNQNRLAFMVTGTCDFSYYDDPERTSTGERTLTDTPSGTIGLYTTTRLVYGSLELITPFYDSVLAVRTPRRTRIGEATRHSKNDGAENVLNRNYVLLADPSAQLALPDLAMTLDSLNGRVLTAASSDTLKALALVRLSGSVRTSNSSSAPVNSSFSGTAQITVYEKPGVVTTLGTSAYDDPIDVPVQENVIYDGQATVTNGRFSLKFVVPRDINYSVGLGKVSLYAANRNSVVDAHGYRAVPVGTAATLAALDTVPPRIRMFMNGDLSFVSGGLTGVTTKLLARLYDESGINTAGSGVGHEITATLDNDPTKLTVLNDFYTASVDSFQTGRVEYLFKDLAPGPHVLHMKAWDTYNNSGTQDIEFIVAPEEKLALKHVLNYPNPFATHTTFHFDHNRPGQDLDVQVQIFTVSGRLVRTLRTTIVGSGSHVPANRNDTSLSWNGRDEFDEQLARGVYIYRVSVQAGQDEGKSSASKFEKLVILN